MFVSDLVGYWFFFDSDDDFFYIKTTDGGATWGGPVEIDADTTIVGVAFDVWYDRWTPGDNGTKIHITWFTTDNDAVNYRALDTLDDSLGSQTIVFQGATSVAGRGIFASITKTRSGMLYVAYDIDAGAERGFHRSTDNGATWSANLSTTFIEATLDQALLFPASNTGDNDDCWAVYYDASATALTLKMWDSSAGAQVESSTFQTHTEGATDLTGQWGFSGAIRHSDGHLILASCSERDTATADHEVFDINGTSAIVTLGPITTNIDDHYHPAIFIDQFTNYIYVFYNGKRDGSETLDTTTKVYYTKSTNNGSSWTSGDTAYMEGAAGVVAQVWAPLMGSRLYAGWRVGTTLISNAVNSIDLDPPLSNLTYDRRRVLTGPFPFPKTTPPFIPTAIQETIVALSGVAATAAIGTMVGAAALGLTGVQGNTGISLGLPTTAVATSGVSATASINSLEFGPTLQGLSATGVLGSPSTIFTIQLTGVQAAGATGNLGASGAAIVNLTGVQATGAVGTEGVEAEVALTGVQATGALGSLSPGQSGTAGLTSVTGTGSVGTLGLVDAPTLSGVIGTGAVGTLSPDRSVDLTGVAATGSVGSLSTNIAFVERPRILRGPFPFPKTTPAWPAPAPPNIINVALTGVEATGVVGDIETPVNFTVALTGIQAVSGIGNVQAGTPGNATLQGVAATGATGTEVVAVTVGLTGVQANTALGTVVPSRLTYDRPISVHGPFPFLPSSGMFQFRERARFVNPQSQPITIQLTGVEATSGLGSIALVRANAVVGAQANTATGALAPSVSEALSGVVATGSVGSVGQGQSLSGVSAAGSVGSVAHTQSVALVGVEAAGSVSSVAAQTNSNVTIGLIGVSATTAVGALQTTRTVPITGLSAPTGVGTIVVQRDVSLQSVTASGVAGTAGASSTSTAALVGLTATASIGTLVPQIAPTLQGHAAIGDVGTLNNAALPFPAVMVALTGVEAEGQLGTLNRAQPVSIKLKGHFKTTIRLRGTVG